MKRTVLILTLLGLIGCGEQPEAKPEKSPDMIRREKERNKVIESGKGMPSN